MRHNVGTSIPKPFALWFITLLGLFGPSLALAQDETSSLEPSRANDNQQPSQSDVAAIRAGSQKFVEAFNNQDAEAIAELWAVEGEYIDDTGRRFFGREAIKEAYAAFFAESPNVTLRVMIDSIRLLADNTAIEDGRAVVEPPPTGVPGFSKYTAVHAKVDGQWLMASVRDAHVETPSTFRNVADLEWLIGRWAAEDNGVKTESVCRWICNKSFVQRTYTITGVDGTKKSGVQMIGWNVVEGHVQSWDFAPDGGHAVGVWSPIEGGWTSEISGMTADGALTSSVNTLMRLDDNAYVWQSVQRTVDGTTLADTDEVVLKRQ